MTTQKLRRVGNSFVVTIPKEEAERLGLQEGDLVGVEVRKLHITPDVPRGTRSVRALAERLCLRLDYLADH